MQNNDKNNNKQVTLIEKLKSTRSLIMDAEIICNFNPGVLISKPVFTLIQLDARELLSSS